MERKRKEHYLKTRELVPDDIREEIEISFAISERIFDILKHQKRTQADLARLLGKSESEISKWLKGNHNFTDQTIRKIEHALGEKIYVIAKGFSDEPQKSEKDTSTDSKPLQQNSLKKISNNAIQPINYVRKVK